MWAHVGGGARVSACLHAHALACETVPGALGSGLALAACTVAIFARAWLSQGDRTTLFTRIVLYKYKFIDLGLNRLSIRNIPCQL